ncbi:hypothetical protein [Thermomonospora echinospora]|nr:hypothetical protein [Thermomonospora echinospora]
MSSFSGWAVVDLDEGRDPGEFVGVLCDACSDPLRVYVDGRRVFVLADFAPQFSAVVDGLVPHWARRAITAADYDEYGVENTVLGPEAQAVHVASISEEIEGLPDADTPQTRRAAAELFGVRPEALDEVSATWAEEGPMPSCIGEPYLRWWAALGAAWPEDFGTRSFDPREKSAGTP